jgi:hypothetical protein
VFRIRAKVRVDHAVIVIVTGVLLLHDFSDSSVAVSGQALFI